MNKPLLSMACHRLAFLATVMLLVMGRSPATLAQPRLITLLNNGPVSNRFNIVVLSEGYTSNQLARFEEDALAAVTALLDRSPYDQYRGYFNAFAIAVASPQPGSDHPANGVYRDTYFNSSYDALSDYLITIPPNSFDTTYSHGQGQVDALLQTFVPRCHLPILLVNDPNIGGSDGFDRTAIYALGFDIGSATDILAHETGHVVAGLGDEYVNPYPGYPDVEEPNTTRETRRDFVKWKAWIDASTPVPTPTTADYSSMVGLFPGAHYHATDWYRPKLNCAMRSVGAPYCEVCQEALVLSFYRSVRPVDGFSPAYTNLLVTTLQPLTFSLSLVQPSTSQLRVHWEMDGEAIAGATNSSLSLQPQDLSNGSHSIIAKVHDDTAMVRNDPAGLLSQKVSWTVTVALPDLRLDSATLLANDKFVLRVRGLAPNGVVLQSSTNLTVWETLLTNDFAGGELVYTNSCSSNDRSRFFRALSL